MEKKNKWLEAIVTVVFDLEEGQLTDYVVPHNYGTEKDRKTISYNSFPDSFTFNLEGQLLYSFYLRKEAGAEEREIVHCYACFSQRKDKTNPRGYFQKSIVFLTKIKIYSFMKKIFGDLGKRYFEEGNNDMLDLVYNTMNNEWPVPDSLEGLSDLELFGTKYQVFPSPDSRFNVRKT
jgi:hypothetical protein